MKQIIYIATALLLCGASLPAQNAESLLDKAAEAYNNSNGISATFAMRTHSEQQNTTESFEGEINIKGDKFTYSTPGLRTWYDGSTQWTYQERSEEVYVNTPSGDDLMLTNPAILLKSYKKGFTASYKGESTSRNGKAAYDIELVPKKKGDILSVSLQIEKTSGLPAAISVKMKNGINSDIQITALKQNVNQPDSYFTFNKADFPDALVID